MASPLPAPKADSLDQHDDSGATTSKDSTRQSFEFSENDEKDDDAPQRSPRELAITIIYLLTWVASSNCIILLNKWVIDTAGFGYPILLTCWHQFFATAALQILARTTKLLDSRHAHPVTPRFIIKTILPIAAVSSGALICSNSVYLYLSVPYIQMLKASSPVFVLFLSWVWGLKVVRTSDIVSIAVICGGVAIASFGEADFSWLGTLIHLTGLLCEALRVVMIQYLLNGQGLELDPLVSLYYFAPCCTLFNFVFAVMMELPQITLADFGKVGIPLLILNGAIAFLVNVSSITLIGRISALFMTLTGIAKNITLIGASVLIWGTTITGLQVFGYSITLMAITWYSNGVELLASIWHMARSLIPSSMGYQRVNSSPA